MMRRALIVLVCIAALGRTVLAQDRMPHPGIGRCPSGQFINGLLPNAGPPNGCGTPTGGGATLTPPISISGGVTNGGNTTDQISGVNIANRLDVTAFGASGLATTNCTGTIAGGALTTLTLTCSPTNDFKVGEGIAIPQAGPTQLYSTPATPVLTVHGTTGATTYTYEVAQYDFWGGLTAVSTSAQVTNGNATLTPSNYIQITDTNASVNYGDACVYRQVGGTGAFDFIAVIPAGSGTIGDTNLPNIATNIPCGATAPAGVNTQTLVTTISHIAGNVITLATAATNAVSGVTIYHDDSNAFQLAATQCTAMGGCLYYIPSGIYNLDRPNYWNGTGYTYTNPTSQPAANEDTGIVHLTSNTHVQGADWASTILQNPLDIRPSVRGDMFVTSNGTSTTIPGAVCNSGAEAGLTEYPITAAGAASGATRGSSFITTSTAANAGNFNPGDAVIVGGGANSSAVSCSASLPLIEPNEVISADATSGRVYLRYPLIVDYPYGTAGTTQFIAQVNPYYHHDVTISDLTFSTLGGAGAATLTSVIRGKFDHVKMLGLDWISHFNLSGSRDIQLVNSIDYESTTQEIDQAVDLKLDNDVFTLQGGNAQFAMSEGTMGITLTRNSFISNDEYAGLNNRIAAGGGQMINFHCENDVTIKDNSFVENTISTSIDIMDEVDPCTGYVVSNWTVADNIFKGTGPSQVNGFTTDAPITNAITTGNKFYINGGAASSSAMRELYGDVGFNQVLETGSEASQGLIHYALTVNSAVPIRVHDNTLYSQSGGDTCFYDNDTATRVLHVWNNNCIDSTGTGFDAFGNSNTNFYQSMGNNLISGANTPYNPAGMIYGNGCLHGTVAPSSAGSGTLTVGASDCYFEVTGTTAFSDTITFQQAFKEGPVCKCADETTTADALACDAHGKSTAVVTGGASNDSFVCSLTGY